MTVLHSSTTTATTSLYREPPSDKEEVIDLLGRELQEKEQEIISGAFWKVTVVSISLLNNSNDMQEAQRKINTFLMFGLKFLS